MGVTSVHPCHRADPEMVLEGSRRTKLQLAGALGGGAGRAAPLLCLLQLQLRRLQNASLMVLDTHRASDAQHGSWSRHGMLLENRRLCDSQAAWRAVHLDGGRLRLAGPRAADQQVVRGEQDAAVAACRQRTNCTAMSQGDDSCCKGGAGRGPRSPAPCSMSVQRQSCQVCQFA